MKELKIKSVKSLGIKDVYNIEMKGSQHNYMLSLNDHISVPSANSHAYAYAVLALQCATKRD